MSSIKLVHKNEAAGKKQLIIYPPDFLQKYKLYLCADTPANRKILDAAETANKIEYYIDYATDTDFITGMSSDGTTGTVPYSKFEANVKKAYTAIKKAKKSGKDSIGFAYDLKDIGLGFGGIDPADMDDNHLETFEDFLYGYVWQDLRDICDEYVAHIKDGAVVGDEAFVGGHYGDISVEPFPGTKVDEAASYSKTWRDIRRTSSLGDLDYMIHGLVNEFNLSRVQFNRLVNSWGGNIQGMVAVFRDIPEGTVPASSAELQDLIDTYRGKLSNGGGDTDLDTAEALVRKAAYDSKFLPASAVLGLELLISKKWPDTSGGASREKSFAWDRPFDLDKPSETGNWRTTPYKCAFK